VSTGTTPSSLAELRPSVANAPGGSRDALLTPRCSRGEFGAHGSYAALIRPFLFVTTHNATQPVVKGGRAAVRAVLVRERRGAHAAAARRRAALWYSTISADALRMAEHSQQLPDSAYRSAT
jgi:hypothetical protein